MNEACTHPLPRVLSGFTLENLPDPVFVFDQQRRLLDGNRAARESAYLESIALFRPVMRGGRHDAFFDELSRHGSAVCEVDYTAADDRSHQLLIQGSRVDCWFVVTVRDVSEQRATEHELRQFRCAESSSLLTARIIHDLNNLLMPILCLSRDLMTELPHSSPAGVLATDLESVALRATSLVRDVLAFARRPENQVNLVDLNAVVSALRPLMELLVGENVELVTLLDGHLEQVRVDRAGLEHALLNLVANARHAMPNGGQLTITTVNGDPIGGPNCDKIDLDEPSGPFVTLAVADTGVGMTDDVRAHAFDTFFTTRQGTGGTGLGLSSVRSFVTDSGGSVSLESRSGEGTRVLMRLPRAERNQDFGRDTDSRNDSDSDPAEASHCRIRIDGHRRSETILLLQSDDSARPELRASLLERGFEVLDSDSVEGVLATLERGVRSGDLVLIDTKLAHADNKHLVDRIHRCAGPVPILLMHRSRGGARKAPRHALPDVAPVSAERLVTVPDVRQPGMEFRAVVLVTAIRTLLDGAHRAVTTNDDLGSADPSRARTR